MRTTDGDVLAEALVERVLGEDAEVADRFPGRDMLGAGYEPPFPFIPASEYGDEGPHRPARRLRLRRGRHRHRAHGDRVRRGRLPARRRAGPERHQPGPRPTAPTTSASARTPGRWVKDADADLIEDLRARGRLLRAERLLHAYPHCWRCGTPLLYYAKPSWYIRTSQLRDRLLAANETVDWHPRAHQARPLRQAGWRTTSTGRSRASATGARRCRSGAARAGTPSAIGSFAELEAALGRRRSSDPHRPYVDERRRCPCARVRRADAPRARGDRRLVRLGLDAVRPVARAVREPGASSRQQFPADYICEAIDQTRGWFYSLLAISTLLFDRSPVPDRALPRPHRRRRGQEDVEVARQHRRAVGGHRPPRRRRVPLVLPHLQAAVGRLPVLDRDGRRVAAPVPAAAVEHVRLLRPLRERQRRRAGRARAPATDLDRWALSRLARDRRRRSRERLDAYDATRAGHAIAAFVDDLSNWYVRRSRRRFWDGDPAAFATLRACLVTRRQAARAVLPVHRRRDLRQPRRRRAERAPRATGPRPAPRDADARVRDGGRARDRAARPRRARAGEAQGPPAAARRGRRRRGRRARGDRAARRTSCSRSSTSRSCATSRRPTSSAPTRSSPTTARSGRASASRCRRSRRRSPRSTRRTSPTRCATAAASAISVDGHDHELGADDLLLAMQPLEGYQLEREGSHAVALELELDDELRREGLAREIVHAVQNARKAAGPAGRGPDRAARSAATTSCSTPRARTRTTCAGETLALSRRLRRRPTASAATIEGRPLTVALRRHERP